MIQRRTLIEELRGARDAGLTLAQLERRIGSGKEAGTVRRRELRDLLTEAEARGEAVGVGKDRWVAVEYSDCYAGIVRMTARGFGIVQLEGTDEEPIVVPPESLGTAMDGDRVLVQRRTRRRRGRLVPERFGDVVRVLHRRRNTLVGRFVGDPNQPWVDPYARRLNFKVLIGPITGEPPRDGEFVEVALEGLPDQDAPATGRLLRRLGAPGESGVDEEVVLADLAVPVEFPPETVREALALPDELGEADLAGRRDLRAQPAVTIDGETAKDFDDAVAAFPSADGAIEVFVHIADVAHYVRPASALDAAARDRGTSVYLPGRAIPMLPEKLSNHLCSLLPDHDRLTFSVRFLVTPSGGVEGYRAERSVFRSRRRCTYTEVFGWLESGVWPAELGSAVRSSLELLDQAAARLRRRREGRGAIDFDLPEPEILLDPDGFMTGIRAVERNRAHRLIEELMITANECVARMLVWGKQPGLFRIHERPSPGKLAELQAVIEEFDIRLKGDLEELPAAELQRVLTEIVGRPEERFLQTLVLRSLARASYHPECRGHYALATDFYLHFTSPIRRYPDLIVHRFLGDLLAGRRLRADERERITADLEELAVHCSFTERRAEEAEREVVRWKQAEYMRARIGEEFAGHVSGVVAFGLFVQLDEVYVEGLVHVSDLKGDYFRYDEVGHRLVGERWGRVLRLGDAVTVRVKGIDEESPEVDLELVGGGDDDRDRDRRPGRGPRPERSRRSGDQEHGAPASRPRTPRKIDRRKGGRRR